MDKMNPPCRLNFLLQSIVMLLLFPLLSLAENRKSEKEIPVIDFKQLLPLLEKDNDTVYVVNFWATWCAPCIKEIPYFEQLGEKYRDQELKVLMVSLDMPNQVESKLIPYIEEHEMRNEVILLDDPRFNDWIPLVEKNWTGAIPATLVYKGDSRVFHAGELIYPELEEMVGPFLSR